MRKTALTLPEIREKLGGRSNGHPSCLLVNELGEIAAAGDAEAREDLVELLDREDEGVRGNAYAWLAMIGKEEDTTTLAQFAAKPENASIVDWARQTHGILPPTAD